MFSMKEREKGKGVDQSENIHLQVVYAAQVGGWDKVVNFLD